MKRFRFFLDGTVFPFITEKPIKSLDKVFDCSLRDVAAVKELQKNLRLGSVQLTNQV